MSYWEDSYDIGGDGVPDDFDSVADFDDGADVGDAPETLGDFGSFDVGASVADVDDADAWIVDLDLGGLVDLADVAVVAGVEDLAGTAGEEGDLRLAAATVPLAPLIAHDLTDVPDGEDPFVALVGRRFDDEELRNEIRHLRVKPPFGTAAAEDVAPAEAENASG